jgi:hypothetical protein
VEWPAISSESLGMPKKSSESRFNKNIRAVHCLLSPSLSPSSLFSKIVHTLCVCVCVCVCVFVCVLCVRILCARTCMYIYRHTHI